MVYSEVRKSVIQALHQEFISESKEVGPFRPSMAVVKLAPTVVDLARTDSKAFLEAMTVGEISPMLASSERWDESGIMTMDRSLVYDYTDRYGFKSFVFQEFNQMNTESDTMQIASEDREKRKFIKAGCNGTNVTNCFCAICEMNRNKDSEEKPLIETPKQVFNGYFDAVKDSIGGTDSPSNLPTKPTDEVKLEVEFAQEPPKRNSVDDLCYLIIGTAKALGSFTLDKKARKLLKQVQKDYQLSKWDALLNITSELLGHGFNAKFTVRIDRDTGKPIITFTLQSE